MTVIRTVGEKVDCNIDAKCYVQSVRLLDYSVQFELIFSIFPEDDQLS